MVDYLFSQEEINDFSKNPITLDLKGKTYILSKKSICGLSLMGNAIPQKKKKLFDGVIAKQLLFSFDIEFLNTDGSSLKFPYSVILNSSTIILSQITAIKDGDNFTFDQINIHFPKHLDMHLLEPQLDIYIN